jgi:hypothetical protein
VAVLGDRPARSPRSSPRSPSIPSCGAGPAGTHPAPVCRSPRMPWPRRPRRPARKHARTPRPGPPAVPPQPGHLLRLGLPAAAGRPLGCRPERNADRRARSDNARPIKVRTPAPGFSTDSDAREGAGFKSGQPPCKTVDGGLFGCSAASRTRRSTPVYVDV